MCTDDDDWVIMLRSLGFIAIAAAIGGLMAVVLIALVFLTGNTYGQRCAHAYPNDGLAQERCVQNLSVGKPI